MMEADKIDPQFLLSDVLYYARNTNLSPRAKPENTFF